MAMIRFRRFVAGLCLVLAAILAVFTGTGIWLERNVLDNANFTRNAERVIKDPAVQAAVAEQVVDQIVANDSKLEIARPFIQPIVEQVVASAPFQKVFGEAVRNSHRVLTEPKAKELVLNISTVVDDVKSVLKEVAPGLANQIPDGKKVEVTVLEKSKLGVIWDTIDLIRQIVLGLTIGFVVLTLLGFLIAPYRWRSLALYGATAAIAAVTLFVILTLGRIITANVVSPDTTVRTAIQHAWNILLGQLMWTSAIIALIGALLFLLGRFVDRSGGWGTSWALIRTAWSRVGRTASAVGASAAQATREAVARADAAARSGTREDGTSPATTGTAPPAEVPVAAVAPNGDVATSETAKVIASARHVWRTLRPLYRAIILVAVGLLALFAPGGVTNVVVALLGIVLLWFAFLEGVAAWRSNRPEEPAGTTDS